MTQAIIPGCEANPDPSTVINVDPTNHMKEIPMNELSNNVENNDAFQKFINAGSAIVEARREFIEDDARLRKENEELRRDNERLLQENKTPEAYQTLKDFKEEMDCIHDDFDIPRDVEELRKALDERREMMEALDNHRIEPDDLSDKLDELDAIKDVMDSYDVDDARDLDDYLEECSDLQKYKKGFKKLAAFADAISDAIDRQNDGAIPSTDIEDYD